MSQIGRRVAETIRLARATGLECYSSHFQLLFHGHVYSALFANQLWEQQI